MDNFEKSVKAGASFPKFLISLNIIVTAFICMANDRHKVALAVSYQDIYYVSGSWISPPIWPKVEFLGQSGK